MTRTAIARSAAAILVLAACTRQDPARVPSETSTGSRSATPSNEWARADEQTVRLPPDKFPTLPSSVASRLRSLGCTVPQSFRTTAPHNVIKGRFIATANADWAVLCSRDRVSSILVFANGSANAMIELETRPDAEWLQEVGGGRIGFSRAIDVAGPQYILEHYQAFGGLTPPPLDHDGINDIFVEKGSVVLYWHEGQWLHLQGAD